MLALAYVVDVDETDGLAYRAVLELAHFLARVLGAQRRRRGRCSRHRRRRHLVDVHLLGHVEELGPREARGERDEVLLVVEQIVVLVRVAREDLEEALIVERYGDDVEASRLGARRQQRRRVAGRRVLGLLGQRVHVAVVGRCVVRRQVIPIVAKVIIVVVVVVVVVRVVIMSRVCMVDIVVVVAAGVAAASERMQLIGVSVGDETVAVASGEQAIGLEHLVQVELIGRVQVDVAGQRVLADQLGQVGVVIAPTARRIVVAHHLLLLLLLLQYSNLLPIYIPIVSASSLCHQLN